MTIISETGSETHFFSLYKAPVGVLKHLESIIRKFLWGGTGNIKKLSWVSWERVASPIDCVGLGLPIHANRRTSDFLPVKASLGGVWGNVVKLLSMPVCADVRFWNLMKGIVGDEKDVAFWLDPWLDKGPLKFRYPNLFQLELDKKCVVRDRTVRLVSNPDASWQWKGPPDSNVELAEWSALCSQLRDVNLSDARDKWRWEGEESGEFSVGSVKWLLDSNIDRSERFDWEWCKWIPLKCNVFAWRAELERLPTRVELRKRNIPIPDVVCPVCALGEETTMHLFTACSLATSIWSRVSRWCKVPFLVAFSFKDILEAHRFSGLKGKDQVAYQGIVISVCCLEGKEQACV
ncbi:putative reverse transcriptase zinc-binding domain-containing protein [Helianthus debilis subsp. tardiflorus]